MVEADKERRSHQKERLFALLEERPAELGPFLEGVHAADLAEWVLDLDEARRWTVFEQLDPEAQAELLDEVEDAHSEELLRRLSPDRLNRILEELPADEVVDLLAQVDAEVAEEVLSKLDFERARELRNLAAYPPDSAGGIMTVEYVHVGSGAAISDAIKLLKKGGDEIEEGVGVFVTDPHRRPIGYVPIRALLSHSIHDRVDDAMTDPFTVEILADQEEAANLIAKYSLRSLAVVDPSGVLVGVITSDDAQEVLEEEASEDMMRLVGTAPVVGSETQVQTRLPVLTRVRHRIPLQVVTVLGGLATAWILDSFIPEGEGSSDRVVSDLLRFLPIVIGLAGNVGVQASTILVRAFATGEVEKDRELSVLGSEVLVGLIIGFLCGSVTAGVATAMDTGADSFGLAVGVAIWVAVTWAAFLGCVVPLSCRRLGIDPAVVAGPFLITLSDISGAVIFFSFGRLLLGLGIS